MIYQESDVSILLPTYKPGPYFRKALESSLATLAGEILVSIDDSFNYPADQFMYGLADNRLKIVRQSNKIGLWLNHLELLKLSTKTWIKFIQHDDKLLPGSLKSMLACMDERVSVVGTLPIYEDLSTGRIHSVLQLTEPKRWESDAYMKRILVVGNELGTPSCTLFRRDTLDITPTSWDNELSCDFINNVIAASRGDVVLMPPGGIVTGIHKAQDGKTQGLASMINRLMNTIAFLRRQSDQRMVRISHVFGAVEFIGALRAVLGALRRGDIRAAKYFRTTFLSAIKYIIISILTNDWYFVKSGLYWKYRNRSGRDVGTFDFSD